MLDGIAIEDTFQFQTIKLVKLILICHPTVLLFGFECWNKTTLLLVVQVEDR